MNNNITEHYNWKVSYEKKFNINSIELWKIISQPSNLELFHPFCKNNNTIVWNEENSIDKIEYYNHRVYTRNFLFWEKNVGYDLKISDKPKKESFVSWRIKKLNKQNSTLKITIYPYILNKGNKLKNFVPFFVFVYPKLRSYLKHIFKGIDWYYNTGNKVSKNQFGKHSWFSIN